MELTEIVLSIVLSGLLMVIMISVYFVCKSRSRKIKIIKRAVADIELEQSDLQKPPHNYISSSLEEKTSGRYKPLKLRVETNNGRDGTTFTDLELQTSGNNQNVLSTIQLKSTSKKFTRLERVI
jgi:hypothetical protein